MGETKSLSLIEKIITIIAVFFVVLLILIYGFGFFISGYFNTYIIHKPTLVTQSEHLFEDNEHIHYIYKYGYLYEYKNNSELNKADNFYNKVDKGGLIDNVFSNDTYLFISKRSFNVAKQQYLYIFDKDFNVINKRDYTFLNSQIISMNESGNILYVLLKRYGCDECFLYSIDYLNNVFFIAKEEVETHDAYIDNQTTIYLDHILESDLGNIYILKDKTKLSYFDYRINFSNKLSIELNDQGLSIGLENETYLFNKHENELELYENSYLINNKIMFATKELIKNDSCGYPDKLHGCFCHLSKSYLYSFDIESKELKLVKQFKEKTFLIDYDFDSVKYYYDGKLYINDNLCR
ncbi:MAG: hypothetical protein J6X03_00315, partial [Bacilli bacterium]|nr:hypothetical protein [Bacilli bacterium]